jgi:quinone-modifying oxidoreductase subunit QmoA
MTPGRLPVLVIGGGIAGITAAVELAEAGCEVILVEKSPTLGGRVARMHQYFPKLCPPVCGLEMHYRRLRELGSITVRTLAEVAGVAGAAGGFSVTLRLNPRFVTDDCTLCGDCAKVCPAERANELDEGMSKTRAAYLPSEAAYPALFAIDRAACPPDCRACAGACRYGAIQLEQKAGTEERQVSAVVAATGWEPYDAAKLDLLGFGRCSNVVTNVMLERMAAANGPTAGKIVRPSDGKEPRTVAFVQCAGSRDENHLPYCSSVCCAASIKHAAYIRALYPETEITVFYIDLRTPGRLEEFQARVVEEARVHLVKGKVARVEQNPATGDLLVTAEEALTSRKKSLQFELVVLATGIVPQTAGLPAAFARDESGFLHGANGKAGFYAAGCAHRPVMVTSAVQDAAGAALKAFQCAQREACHG